MKRKKANQANPKVIARKIAQGHGQGEGENYIPWLSRLDFSSNGIYHRMKSWKCGRRVIELFSTLEYEVALLLDWRDDVVLYYEQFPLHAREETAEIARELGVKPPSVRGVPIVMTSDFRIRLKNSFEIYSVKPAALITERVLEKFLIEKTYWEKRNTPCRLLTDEQLPKSLIASLRKIRPEYHLKLAPNVVDQAELVLRHELERKATMVAAAGQVDALLGLEPGSGLVILKHLLARKKLPLDPLHTLNFSEPLFTLWKN